MFRFRNLLPLLLSLVLAFAAAAEGIEETASPSDTLATTSWTAAFAAAAGIDDVAVLAPYELQHPPEYELSPGDIRAVAEARLIIFAGYEVMLSRLRESAASEAKMVQIETVNTWPVIEKSVRTIAAAAGTEEEAEGNLAEIGAFFDDWRTELAPHRGTKVITHMFLQGLAKNLGFEVVGTFGPAPMEARQIRDLAATDAALIIDNWHSRVGGPVREILAEIPAAELINFPGRDGTRSLLDVLSWNREALAAALD